MISPGSIHRDLSWLQFNDRVLNEAKAGMNPPMERAKFLGISASNLDEFFMIRFSSLGKSITRARSEGNESREKELEETRALILREVNRIRGKQAKLLGEVSQDLARNGIRIFSVSETNKDVLDLSHRIFEDQVLRFCGQPEAFGHSKVRMLGNLQTAVIFPDGVWCPVAKALPAIYCGTGKGGLTHIFFLDDLLLCHLREALGLRGAPALIRLTRDGDVKLDFEEEDSESIPRVVRDEIVAREKGRPVRLQYAGLADGNLLRSCLGVLKLAPEQLFQAPRTLYLQGLLSVAGKLPESRKADPTIFFPAVKPALPKVLRKSVPTFEILKKQDILLHHPYDSFDAFVSFIRKACSDPDTISVQMTVYRTDAVSPIIDALKQAARSGKKVRVLIELRARFDELNNLRLAESLRHSGVEVFFGFGRLKLHAKIALVERREDGQVRRYTHLSTGNYNATTARQYTDLAVLTSNRDIGADAMIFFDSVARGQLPTGFRSLVSAPGRLHRKILHHIELETKAAREGRPARIFAKVNALVDNTVASALYKASCEGVKIDLVVRGACTLLPGVPGLSENIRVISIVDRYLEHSRIYWFESTAALYLSSADWMQRNFFSRLEIAFPVLDPRIQRFMRETLIPTYLADTAKARELAPNGTWRARPHSPDQPRFRSQFHFQELAQRDYKGTALE